MERCLALADQAGEHFERARRADGACHFDRPGFARELVDPREALHALTAGGGVENEVLGSDVMGTYR
jgi:hypothetical protein